MLDIESGVSGDQTPLLGQRGKLSERYMTVYRYGLKSGVRSPLTPLGAGALRLLAVSSLPWPHRLSWHFARRPQLPRVLPGGQLWGGSRPTPKSHPMCNFLEG
jgi:hypothetical protein